MIKDDDSPKNYTQVNRKAYTNQLNISGMFFFGVSLFLFASLAWDFISVDRSTINSTVSATIAGLTAQKDIDYNNVLASIFTMILNNYLNHIMIFLSGLACIFMGYLLLSQAGTIGKETISEQDQKLLNMLSENDEKGVGVDQYIRLTSLTGITGFFTKVGITGLPLATISLTLMFGILALLTPDTDASSKFFDFANLALGAFLGSYVQKQEPKSNIVNTDNKSTK